MGILVSTLYNLRALRPTLKFRNLTVPVAGPHVSRSAWKHIWKGGYEKPEIDAALSLLQPGDRVLELGTGMGIVSSVLAKTDPTVQVETYEANPTLLPAIAELHRMNEIDNVNTNNAILLPNAEAGQTIQFNLHASFAESSIREIESANSTQVAVADFQETFDAFRPDVMLCDIEGAEAQLFRGISLKGLRALVIELHPEHISDEDIGEIYARCDEAGLQPRKDLFEKQVEVFAATEAGPADASDGSVAE